MVLYRGELVLEKRRRLWTYTRNNYIEKRRRYGLIRGIIILKSGEGFALFEVLY